MIIAMMRKEKKRDEEEKKEIDVRANHANEEGRGGGIGKILKT